jgi:hypothetical protein
MSVIERKTRHQRTFERDSGGSKPYSLVATNSCGTRIDSIDNLSLAVLPNLSCKKQKINGKINDSIKAEYPLKIL